MFSSVIVLFTSILEALNKLDFDKKDKRRIGNELAQLYLFTIEILSNGKEIIKVLFDFRENNKVDTKELMKSLEKQAVRIKKAQKLLKKSQIETVLKIHLPRLEDLHIWFDYKSLRIAVLTEQLQHQKLIKSHNFGFFPILSPQFKDRIQEIYIESIKFIPPDDQSLKISSQNLNKIEELSEELREFLLTKFEVQEIL